MLSKDCEQILCKDFQMYVRSGCGEKLCKIFALSVCQHGMASVSAEKSPFQQVLSNLAELQENLGLRQKPVGLRNMQMGEGLCVELCTIV